MGTFNDPCVTINFQVSAGDYHSVLLRSDGLVVTCGDNSYGQSEIPPPETGKHYVCHGHILLSYGHGYQLQVLWPDFVSNGQFYHFEWRFSWGNPEKII